MKRILKNSAAIIVLVFGMAAGCALQTAAAAQNMPSEDAGEQAMPLESTFVLSAAGQSSAAEDDAAQADYSVNIGLDSSWQYAGFSEINTGHAVLYKATGDSRRNLTVAVNAGHGTKGGASVKTYCHPDKTPKVTGGTTKAGALKAVAVSSGMTYAGGGGNTQDGKDP